MFSLTAKGLTTPARSRRIWPMCTTRRSGKAAISAITNHLKVRLEQDKVCLLVMIGVRADGKKELVALDDGHRESTESWADLLRDCKRRGMRAPVLATGDGALGFWAALREVFPETAEQRCWFHKVANVLNCLPTSAQPGAKKALAEVWQAADREHAEAAGVAMAFKLIESAQARWGAVNAHHLVPLVRAGARFEKGILVERPDEHLDHESGRDQQAA